MEAYPWFRFSFDGLEPVTKPPMIYLEGYDFFDDETNGSCSMTSLVVVIFPAAILNMM